jgi:1-acyl-sn-glycerol-3-phosphate acyltransferase
MKKRQIYQSSLRYKFLQIYLRFCHNRIFYRQVVVQNFPTTVRPNTPLLIVANHQNTLMDALAIVFNVGALQPVFLARADLFQNSLFRKFLTFLKMLPVYRTRDGLANMREKNEEIFEQCAEILTVGNPLVIFPEGNHDIYYNLRPIKKGTARIALLTEEKNNWQSGLQILPCGLYYTHCQRMGEKLVLNFGQPFGIEQYRENYNQNKSLSVNELTVDIEKALKPLMIHVEDLTNHDTIKFSIDLNCCPTDVLSIQRHLQTIDESHLQQMKMIKEDFKNHGIDPLIAHKKSNLLVIVLALLGLFVTAPLALYGWLNNVIPYSIPFLITRKLKDKQFSNAIRFVAYFLLTFPIFYLLQTLLIAKFTQMSCYELCIYFLSLPSTGYFAHRWARGLRWAIQQSLLQNYQQQ